MCNLRPQTSVCSSLHQGTLPPTRNKVGIFYSLVFLNWWTDKVRQPRVGPVPPALCERKTRRLVQSLTPGGIPAQQLCPLYYSTASISARHQVVSSYGLQNPTEPFWSRDNQQVHEKNKDGNWRSKVCNLQSTERHKKILWLTKNSSSSVQT